MSESFNGRVSNTYYCIVMYYFLRPIWVNSGFELRLSIFHISEYEYDYALHKIKTLSNWPKASNYLGYSYKLSLLDSFITPGLDNK